MGGEGLLVAAAQAGRAVRACECCVCECQCARVCGRARVHCGACTCVLLNCSNLACRPTVGRAAVNTAVDAWGSATRTDARTHTHATFTVGHTALVTAAGAWWRCHCWLRDVWPGAALQAWYIAGVCHSQVGPNSLPFFRVLCDLYPLQLGYHVYPQG
jgi:hypothetical protein